MFAGASQVIIEIQIIHVVTVCYTKWPWYSRSITTLQQVFVLILMMENVSKLYYVR